MPQASPMKWLTLSLYILLNQIIMSSMMNSSINKKIMMNKMKQFKPKWSW